MAPANCLIVLILRFRNNFGMTLSFLDKIVMLNLFQHPLLSLSGAVQKDILDCKIKGCHFHRYRLTQVEISAEGGTRTRTGKNPRDFKSLASTGSATSAFGDEEQTQVKFYYF